MAIQYHIFFHMSPVYTQPFSIHAVDIRFPDQNGLILPEQSADLILRLPVLFNIHIFHNAMHSFDKIKQALIFFTDCHISILCYRRQKYLPGIPFPD